MDLNAHDRIVEKEGGFGQQKETSRLSREVCTFVYTLKSIIYSKSKLGSQPTRSAEARSFSRARFWIWRTRSLLMRSRWPIWRRLCVPLPVRPKRRSRTFFSRGRRFSIRKPRASWRSVLVCVTVLVVVGHRLGELEIAVVVEDGVEGNRRARGGLQVGQVFEAAAGAVGEFLRAGQVLAAVGQGFGFLLQQAEFLQGGAATG